METVTIEQLLDTGAQMPAEDGAKEWLTPDISKAVDACPRRVDVSPDSRGKEAATCVLSSDMLGIKHGVGRRICEWCALNGPPDAEKNPYFKRLLLSRAFLNCYRFLDPAQTFDTTDEVLDKSIAVLRLLSGEDAAGVFINTVIMSKPICLCNPLGALDATKIEALLIRNDIVLAAERMAGVRKKL